ncbi:response regulator transcription factor [Microbacterium sp. W1N]|uniref:response regulator transcription factor n=1 Tax=Microbacterium festucae TaxID=2977531 RepID=UPI0021BECF6E|nr:response regulator transcription factor [Microbacterium festucae]MCT9819057.1 response regulator transcription factor [Microbacterium festucae]
MGQNTAVVIDDDPDVRALIVNILASSGFEVFPTDNGVEGVEAVFAHDPVITTLDVNMPGIDGYETARRIRERSSTYIVIITALTDEADAVLGFSVGADDVVSKPFRARELRARLLAAQRRQATGTGAPTALPVTGASAAVAAAAPALQPIGWNGLKLVRGAHEVTVDDEPVSLTRTEFDLLATILESAPEVRSKADLVHSVRDDPRLLPVSDADERAIETHMANLRRKLGESAATPRFIETVRGVGYRAITSSVES